MLETLKTVGVILIVGGAALVLTWPLARLIVPPHKGEDF